MSIWVTSPEPVELRPNASVDDLEAVIQAVYKQVLGNHHIMESQRLESGESLLRNGDITVRGFVRAVAKSDLYRSLFFEASSAYTFIEKNFQNLLGRAPEDQSEISAHTAIYSTRAYEGEIDSYLDSDEYCQNFGENTVPYLRGQNTESGMKNVRYNRTLVLAGGNASNKSGSKSKLTGDLARNLSTKIKSPKGVGLGRTGRNGRFRIAVSGANTGGDRTPRSNASFEIGYNQLQNKIRTIQRSGGKILSIEPA
ncbi:phycobilisome rod-core linker polypeptide [cf. Phormidesmis sp. LEGE 11477]|uniref:phycobilisome rod-core linker polypeptide n=1 Tax=cf. Phormidesmis sp. LEGE 11477 TaxID=1828680 RepID=UPI0018817EA7|nr:phycobilisome rod-core linker polypeptide [cf. Phormidesmis sp. LEGE 11477]MBE9060210.1 phycobilisome rod-core linker polypeptide [cf. Phormidesmis sp. LEGE 11477]